MSCKQLLHKDRSLKMSYQTIITQKQMTEIQLDLSYQAIITLP